MRRGRPFLRAALAALCALGAGCASEPAADAPADRGPPARHGFAVADVARDVGLHFRHGAFRWDESADAPAMMGGGVCWLDYDGDGWLDLFVVDGWSLDERDEWLAAGELPTSRLFRNERGRFRDVTDEAGAGVARRGQGCVAADLDSDGHTDLYVTAADQNALLWNDGDGGFTEGGEAAGVGVYGWYTGAAAGDVDGDGRLDLVVTGYVDLVNRIADASLGFPNTYVGRRDLLFLNQGQDGDARPTFREVGEAAGLEVTAFGYGLGVILSDLDADGDADVYVANDTNPNRLYENVRWPGGARADPAGLGFRFEERAGAAGAADTGSGMGIAGEDVDDDGRTDLFVSNSRGQVHAVYMSNPPGELDPSFADVRAALGVDLGDSTGWGASWSDLDLDTDLDLVLVNGDVPVTDLTADAEPIRVFLNLTAEGRPGRFADVGARVGAADVGPLLGRGSAAADYDNDGDVDVAAVAVGGPLVLLQTRGAAGNWLEVALTGSPPGAAVTVRLPDGRRLRRELKAGSSYLSSEDPRLHFGLGAADEVSEVVVRWPGGGRTRLTGVDANQLLTVDAP